MRSAATQLSPQTHPHVIQSGPVLKLQIKIVYPIFIRVLSVRTRAAARRGKGARASALLQSPGDEKERGL
jgi:hypothetical protein